MEKKDSAKFELVSIHLVPVVKIASILFFIVGIVIGVFAFLVFPHPSSTGLSFSTRLLSALLFSLLYTVLVTLVISFLIGLYNLLTSHSSLSISFVLSPKSGRQD